MNLREGVVIKNKKSGDFFRLGRPNNSYWWSFSSLTHSGVMQISIKGLRRYEITNLTEQEAKLIMML